MKSSKKYEAIIIATNKKLMRKTKRTNKVRAVRAKTPKSAKSQIRVLMREVKRLNKMLVKMAKHCA